MDDDFAGFLTDFGPAIESRHVPPSSIDRYRGRLPDQLLDYWEQYGWCGYADGLFWTVDPQEYETVLDAWIGATSLKEQDVFHIIARTAFGELYCWGEKTGYALSLFAPGSFCTLSTPMLPDDDIDFEMQLFFGAQSRNGNDFEGKFAPALAKLGRLKYDEMYGFLPALALGGSDAVASLQKVKAVPHLVFLAQLEPLRVITSPSF